MSLKKYLKRCMRNKAGQALRLGSTTLTTSRSGQVVMEYFILLVVLATLTIVGSSLFFNKARKSTDSFMTTAVKKMKQPGLGTFQDIDQVVGDVAHTY